MAKPLFTPTTLLMSAAAVVVAGTTALVIHMQQPQSISPNGAPVPNMHPAFNPTKGDTGMDSVQGATCAIGLTAEPNVKGNIPVGFNRCGTFEAGCYKVSQSVQSGCANFAVGTEGPLGVGAWGRGAVSLWLNGKQGQTMFLKTKNHTQQKACLADKTREATTFWHKGGRIGVSIFDSHHGDNSPGETSLTFNMEPVNLTPAQCLPACGNGVKNEGEECDDGNRANGDGCSESCAIEGSVYGKSTDTSKDEQGICGDGAVDEGEECDDGNTVNGDGCSNVCAVETSGGAMACCGIVYGSPKDAARFEPSPESIVQGVPLDQTDYPEPEPTSTVDPNHCPCDGHPIGPVAPAHEPINPFLLPLTPERANLPSRVNYTKVNRMDPRLPRGEPPQPFTCGEFACAALKVFSNEGRNAWILGIKGKVGDRELSHAMNVVQVTPLKAGEIGFVVYEPQTDQVVAYWGQKPDGTRIRPGTLPPDVKTRLQDYYKQSDIAYSQITDTFFINDCTRTPFAIAGMAARFEQRTTYEGVDTWGMGTPPPEGPGVAIIPNGWNRDLKITESHFGTPDKTSYTIVLNSAPLKNVTIVLNTGTQVTVAPATLEFTPENWHHQQTVTVTIVDDNVVEGPHTATITHTASSDDRAYRDLTIADATVNITDNDVGVKIVESDGSTDVKEGDATEVEKTDTFTIQLTSVPIFGVIIKSITNSQLRDSPGVFLFTKDNWNVPQTVTVGAYNDGDVEGPHTAILSYTAKASENNVLPIPSVTVHITDPE